MVSVCVTARRVFVWCNNVALIHERIKDTSVIAKQKIERNMLSFRNALSLMILTHTRDSNLMCNALELAQSEIRVLALIKLLYPELIQN